MNTSLEKKLNQAVKEEKILDISLENIKFLLNKSNDPLYEKSLVELVDKECWDDLNDRFFKFLTFGTGGLRGRTIGNISTLAEIGESKDEKSPEYPCAGTNAMNYFNISRALQGWVNFLNKNKGSSNLKLVLAHDTRMFSRKFAEFSADILSKLGVNVYLFEGPRSTPQLSYTVRKLSADGGAVFTASHNPPHDNGFKVYTSDGGQIINPFDKELITHVESIKSDSFTPLSENSRGKIYDLGKQHDDDYFKAIDELFINKDFLKKDNSDVKIVYTNLHGTGGRMIPRILSHYGVSHQTVKEQDNENGFFPTVESPNPEEPKALSMAIEQAREIDADVVIGTDPDCDRLAIAVRKFENLANSEAINRNKSDEFVIISGNQLGAMFAHYRIKALKKVGLLNNENIHRSVIIKTFVTTELQRSIAEKEGAVCLDTLTGFKYISSKLNKYSSQVQNSIKTEYTDLEYKERSKLLLKHSRFYICGGEESFGYLGSDLVRDKDANGAALMLVELLLYAKSKGSNLLRYLDYIYTQYGYFKETLHSLKRPGAKGALEIKKLTESLINNPPKEIDGSAVSKIIDFSKDDIVDIDGDLILKENMIFIYLEDDRYLAVRPSGTEPKIKFYLMKKVNSDKFDKSNLQDIKDQTDEELASLWKWLNLDAENRIKA